MDNILIWLGIAAFLGLFPGAIASGKGHSFLGWWFFGAALFIVALPCAILVAPAADHVNEQQRAKGMKKCPACAEMIQGEAIKCRYCGTSVEMVAAPAPPAQPAPTQTAGKDDQFIRRFVISGVVLVITVALVALALKSTSTYGAVDPVPTATAPTVPVPPVAAVRRTVGRPQDVPKGVDRERTAAQFVGDLGDRRYMPARCEVVDLIPRSARVYFATEADAIAKGWARLPAGC